MVCTHDDSSTKRLFRGEGGKKKKRHVFRGLVENLCARRADEVGHTLGFACEMNPHAASKVDIVYSRHT